MFGILSSSLRVATRTDGWGQYGKSGRKEPGLPAHWREQERQVGDRPHSFTRDWIDRVHLTGK